MKQSEIKELSAVELQDRLTEEKLSLTKMKMGHSISPMENPLQIRSVRKTVARLLTEVRRRELQEESN